MLLQDTWTIKCNSQYKACDTCELLGKDPSQMSEKYLGYLHCLWLSTIMDKTPLLKTAHFGYWT